MSKADATVLLVVWWPVGGIRTYIRYLYRHFVNSGYRFIVLATDSAEFGMLQEELKDLPIEFESCPRSPGKLGYAVLKLLRTRDITLVHSHGLSSAMFSVLQTRLKRVPHVVTLHDVFDQRQWASAKGKLRWMIANATLRGTDAVHVVGSGAAQNTLEHFPSLRERRFELIPNGIEPAALSSEIRDVRSELGLKPEHYLIGFLGRFMSQKGFSYLVDAIEMLVKKGDCPRVPVVISTGSGGFVREEKEQIRKRGLQDYFHFLPFTSNIGALARGLDVVAMPSLWEAGPILPMEILTLGVPIIGTSCIGLREVLADTPAAVVPPRDAVALANAIEAEMRSDRRAEFEQYASTAAKRFSIRSAAEAVQKMYDDLIATVRTAATDGRQCTPEN